MGRRPYNYVQCTLFVTQWQLQPTENGVCKVNFRSATYGYVDVSYVPLVLESRLPQGYQIAGLSSTIFSS